MSRELYSRPVLGKRLYSAVDEATTTMHSHVSNSTPSSSTRRRKRVRSRASQQKMFEQYNEIRNRFNHFNMCGRDQAYSKLDTELVIAPPDPLVYEFAQENPIPVADFDQDDWTFVKACTPVEMNHLAHFNRPIKGINPKYEAAIERAANYVADLLYLPEYLLFPSKSDLQDVPFSASKFGGIDYARMGMKTRADANDLAQIDAERAWDELMAGRRVIPHDVRLGGRGKITKMSKEEATRVAPPVGRLILMMSQRDLKLCGATETLLTRAYTPQEYPISVGLGWFHTNPLQFIMRFLHLETYYCFDAKKYDSSLDRYLGQIAVNIMRSQFLDGMDSKYDAYWEFVLESLFEPVIFRDDGIRMQKFVGTTSGHSHNTLLQSICTLIIGYTAVMCLAPHLSDEDLKKMVWMEALGDDNITGVKGEIATLTVEQISDMVYVIFAVDWFGKKSFATTRLMDPVPMEFQGIQYLGKYFYLGDYPTDTDTGKTPLPYRPTDETFLRLLYPEHGQLTMTDTYLRALGNYLDAAGNPLMERWMCRFMDWLEERGARAPSAWPENYRRMLVRDYTGTGVEVPPPERINFEQWRDLVVLDDATYVAVWKWERPKQDASVASSVGTG